MEEHPDLMSPWWHRDRPHPDIRRHTRANLPIYLGTPTRIPRFGQYQQASLLGFYINQQRVGCEMADGRRRGGQGIRRAQRFGQRLFQQRRLADVVTACEPVEGRLVVRLLRPIHHKRPWRSDQRPGSALRGEDPSPAPGTGRDTGTARGCTPAVRGSPSPSAGRCRAPRASSPTAVCRNSEQLASKLP